MPVYNFTKNLNLPVIKNTLLGKVVNSKSKDELLEQNNKFQD